MIDDLPYMLDPVYQRDDPAAVGRALRRLGVDPPRLFVAFYERYAGVIGSDNTAMELLDLGAGEPDFPYHPSSPTVVASTELVREMYALPPQFLVISDYVGNAVWVYDTTTDLVYMMDFEGGDVDLREGVLEPMYPAFRALLDAMFGPGEAPATPGPAAQ